MKPIGMILIAAIVLVAWDESFHRGQYRYELQKMGKRSSQPFEDAERKTQAPVEREFWEGLKSIAKERGATLTKLLNDIGSTNGKQPNLSSATRVFVLKHFKEKARRVADQVAE